MAQEFNAIQHLRIAETLFCHEYGSDEKVKGIIKGILRDAIEFRFCNGMSPVPYLQRRIDALMELKEEYEQKET